MRPTSAGWKAALQTATPTSSWAARRGKSLECALRGRAVLAAELCRLSLARPEVKGTPLEPAPL